MKSKIIVTAGDKRWPHTRFNFSGGEVQVQMASCPGRGGIEIAAYLRDSDGIMELMLVADAISRLPDIRNKSFRLVCPYLPYARQDRVCAPGEAFSLSIMADMLNSCGFDSVTVWDVHSREACNRIGRVINAMPSLLATRYLNIDADRTVFVAPDKGATGRLADFVGRFGGNAANLCFLAGKVRDPNTGAITGTELVGSHEHIGDKDFFIVDDICDGGRTFIELAKLLRPLTNGKIKLWVTHGIFSKGLGVFEGLIDEIWTANNFLAEPGTGGRVL